MTYKKAAEQFSDIVSNLCIGEKWQNTRCLESAYNNLPIEKLCIDKRENLGKYLPYKNNWDLEVQQMFRTEPRVMERYLE